MNTLHAVVTGGGSGIGAAIAKGLAEHGTRVTLMGRDLARLQRTRDAIERASHRIDDSARTDVAVSRLDVCDAASVQAAFEAGRELAPIDILVNNVGSAESESFLQTSLELWQRMLDVNLTGAFLCTQQVLPAMVERGFGRIVNIASTAALKGYPYVAAYCAAKHGLLGLTRALALEVAKTGVTVNAVCPGYTDTGLVDRSVQRIVQRTGRSAEQARAALAAANPQGRLIEPDEVAHAVLWLVQRESEAINGQAIAVAGGEVT